MSDILKVGIEAAREAGKFLSDSFGKITRIEKKGDRNFVTNLDKEAEKIIIDRIRNKFANHGIIAEESGKKDIDKEYLWIIDPLDGTHNFIREIDIFGVSIGVLHRKEFVAGIIYIPRTEELYTAEKGSGAYKNGKKIRVSCRDKLNDCSISFDSSIRYASGVMLKVLGELAEEVFNVRMLGSSARQLSYLADGRLDAVIEFHDMPWDFAGGVCIVEEAGGRLGSLKDGPLSYKDVGYIASNGLVHEKIKDIILKYLKNS